MSTPGAGADPDEGFDVRRASTPGGDLAARLLAAHARVRGADLSDQDRARAVRRLIALSDAAKHDLGRASVRLDALLADLDAGRVAAADA